MSMASLSLISSSSSSPRPAVHQQFPITTVSSLGYVRFHSFKAGAKLAGGGGLSPLLLRTMHRDEVKTSISVRATKAKEFPPEENSDSYRDATTEEKEFNLHGSFENLVYLIVALKCFGRDVTKGTAIAEHSIYKAKLFVKQSAHKIMDVEDIIRSICSDYQYSLDVDSPQKVEFTNEGNKSVWLIKKAGQSLKLLSWIIKIIQYNNVDIASIEFDIQGLVPEFKFHLSYKGHALGSSLQRALTNYFLKVFPR